MARRDSKLTGVAGEHHVCAELARRGWAPSLTRDGLERTDILAVHTTTRVMIEVQVKTAWGGMNWPMHRKGIVPAMSEREWYIFVKLGDPPAQPRCWIVPRDHVAAGTWIGHMAWLTDSNAKPGSRNTGIEGARASAEYWEQYEDRWDLLQEPATAAPVLLPEWMRGQIDNALVGLPEGHPRLTDLPTWSASTAP